MIDVFVGWDGREAEAYDVCVYSLRRRSDPARLTVEPLKIEDLRSRGLYTRPTEQRNGHLWDVISDAPMSTEFSLTRFLVPHLGTHDWALYCDSDFLWLDDIAGLLALADPHFAVMVVKHDHRPAEDRKMDGRVQLRYQRKNWSSLVLWNRRHPAHRALTLDAVNARRGLDLHRFFWLEDDDIGGLPESWNWLEGHSAEAVPRHVIHFTRGGPWFNGITHIAHGDLWLAERARMKAAHASKSD